MDEPQTVPKLIREILQDVGKIDREVTADLTEHLSEKAEIDMYPMYIFQIIGGLSISADYFHHKENSDITTGRKTTCT